MLALGAAEGGLASQLGKASFEGEGRPLTSASKSSPSPPPLASNAVPVRPPNATKSSLGAATLPFDGPDSSCNLLACSSSTLRERLLMSSMKDWNC